MSLHNVIRSSRGVLRDLFSDRRVRIHYRGAPFDNCLYSVGEELAIERVEEFAIESGVRGAVFMPKITAFDGKIAPHSSFKRSPGSLMVLNSAVADGVVVAAGQAAVFATGDCPTLVMHAPGDRIAVAAHAGRKSLIGKPLDGRRPDEGIVFEMAGLFPPSRRADVEVAFVLGIDGTHFPHRPDDPAYALENRVMIDFVRSAYGDQCFVDLSTGSLSLLELVRAQCAMAGIPKENVRHDGFDTFSTRLDSGAFAFHSNRRYELDRKEKGLKSKPAGRNILLVEVV